MSSKVENAFKYLSDVDESTTISNIIIHGVVDFNGSPHKNKKAYDIDMVYSSGVQNYTSQLGINLFPLADIGKYTLIMEYYFSPDNTNINIIANVTKTTTIKKQTTFDEPNYKKYLVQFDFPSKANPPHFINFTISGSGTTSTNPEGYLVFYGVKGWDDSVPPEIYDHALETGMFEYDNGNMKMYHDIDMDNHRIRNIPPATNPTDLLMKKSLKIFNINHMGQINKGGFFTVGGINIELTDIFLTKVRILYFHRFLSMSENLILYARIPGSFLESHYFSFTYPSDSLRDECIISINKHFELIHHFRMDTARQLTFIIHSAPLIII